MKTVDSPTQVDGLDVFCLEAGPQDGPAMSRRMNAPTRSPD